MNHLKDTRATEDRSEWIDVDPFNCATWPQIGKKILAERRDGFRAYLKRNMKDELFYLAYPDMPNLPIAHIKSFRYAHREEE